MDIAGILAIILSSLLIILCIIRVGKKKSKAVEIFAEIADEKVKNIVDVVSKISIKEITFDSPYEPPRPQKSKTATEESAEAERLSKKRKCLKAAKYEAQ